MLSNIRQRFRKSQIKAAVKINDTLIEFYWSVGSDIVEMQNKHKWGSGVIKQLSLDLRAAFPCKEGFSVRNLEYMRKLYLFYHVHFSKSNQVGAIFTLPEEFSLVPWRYHVHIIYKCKTVEEALFYIHKTIEQNWSRSELEDNVSDNLYKKQGKALTNFEYLLPEPQSNLAQSALKDPYNFEFVSMKKGYNELQLEEALILFLTVSGDKNDNLTLKYFKVDTEEEFVISENVIFNTNTIIGSVDEPYVLNCNINSCGDTDGVTLYPNPVTTNREINLGVTCTTVEVYNSLGAMIAKYDNIDKLTGIETSGIYMIKTVVDNEVKYHKLIVK